MASRTRSYSLAKACGSRERISDGVTNSYSGVLVDSTCTDTIGNRDRMNPFYHQTRQVATVAAIGLDQPKQYSLWKFRNYQATCCQTPGAHTYPSHSYKKTPLEAMKGSHPGEPAISLPNFLYEMKELPGMYKHYARLVRDFRSGKKKRPTARDAANEWLAYSFGWAPMFSDFESMFEVAKGAEQQAKRLQRIRERGWCSTRGRCGESETVSFDNHITYDQPTNTFGTLHTVSFGSRWTSARWRASTFPPIYSSLVNEKNRLLLDQLGLDVSFDTIWNAIPWTWLVDWTTDLSSIFSIYSNRSGFKFIEGCVMEHVETTKTYRPKNSPIWGDQEAVTSFDQKVRTMMSPSLSDVGINFLDSRKLSLLSSLVIARNYGVARRN